MSNKNSAVKGKAGAPAKPIFLPRGKFTIEQAYQFNVTEKANKVCKLTVRKYVESSAAGYRIVKKNGVAKKIKVEKLLNLLDEVAKKETAGRPNFLYTKASGVVAPKATKVKAVKAKVTPTVTPVAAAVVPDVTPVVVTPVVAVTETVVPTIVSPVAASTEPVAY
jgi:hypothetical protein